MLDEKLLADYLDETANHIEKHKRLYAFGYSNPVRQPDGTHVACILSRIGLFHPELAVLKSKHAPRDRTVQVDHCAIVASNIYDVPVWLPDFSRRADTVFYYKLAEIEGCKDSWNEKWTSHPVPFLRVYATMLRKTVPAVRFPPVALGPLLMYAA